MADRYLLRFLYEVRFREEPVIVPNHGSGASRRGPLSDGLTMNLYEIRFQSVMRDGTPVLWDSPLLVVSETDDMEEIAHIGHQWLGWEAVLMGMLPETVVARSHEGHKAHIHRITRVDVALLRASLSGADETDFPPPEDNLFYACLYGVTVQLKSGKRETWTVVALNLTDAVTAAEGDPRVMWVESGRSSSAFTVLAT